MFKLNLFLIVTLSLVVLISSLDHLCSEEKIGEEDLVRTAGDAIGKFSFKMKFILGLPSQVSDQILLFGHSPEALSMKKLFEVAIQVEQIQ